MARSAEEARAANTEVKRRSRAAAKAAAQAKRPPLKRASTCAAWTGANLELVAQSSAVPGRFIPWEHQVAWLNLPFVEGGPRIITIQKCARAGYSKVLLGIAGWGALKGKNALLVQPRHKDAISFRDDSLAPTLEACFGKESHLGLPWSKSELHLRPTALSPIQVIRCLAGNVSLEMRRLQSHFACIDEADSFDLDIQGDGNILERLASRLRESRGILIAGSTPTRRGNLLDIAMADSDLVFTWMFSCPSCEAWQEYDFDRLTDEGLACVDCGEIHAEGVIRKTPRRWQAMDGRYVLDDGQSLSEGAWPHAVGFRINALAVPSLGWDDLLQADRRAKTPEARKVVRNEILGLPWGASGRAISVGELLDKRQALESDSGRCRVMGVDVQKDRVEAMLVEWDENERAYILDYQVVEGDTDQPRQGAWLALGALADRWKVFAGLCDSGYRGDGSFAFCKPRYGWRAFKGLAKPPAAGGLYRVSRQRDRQIDLVTADVSMAKTIIYDRLSDDRNRWFHWNQGLDEAFFNGLLSEELRIVDGRNKWVKLHSDNEVLDTLVMCLTAFRFATERLRWQAGNAFPVTVPRRKVVKAIGWD